MRSSNGQVVATSAGFSVGELRTRLLWVTVFRSVATTLLLAATTLRLITNPPPELATEDALGFFVIVCVYVLTIVYALVLRGRTVGTLAAYVQVLGDVLAATALVYVSGGAESPFTFAYLIAIVVASILLYGRGALVAAFGSAVAYAWLTLSIHQGWIRPPTDSTIPGSVRIAFLVGSNVLAQFLIAALAGYLSRQLRSAGGRLHASQSDLRALSQLQQQILASMPSGLVTCDAMGVITYGNHAAEVILGHPADELMGQPVSTVLPGALKLEPMRRSEIDVPTPLGLKTLGLTLRSLDSQPGAVLIVFQDLTDLRRMEDEVRRVDRLASLGKLAAQLAHEIRNPLASMRGSAQMLAQESVAPHMRSRLSQILVREADRLSGLVEDFLRFARPPPPTLQGLSLDTLVSDTVDMLREDPLARGLSLHTQLQPVKAKVDADQMRQVLINLLRNAFQAAHPTGQVRVSVLERGGKPEIHVWDSAGSIPHADLARIFEPFFTTREGGTGLGLSTAHSIIRAHGGNIRVSSSPAEGTLFTLTLQPAHEEALAHTGS